MNRLRMLLAASALFLGACDCPTGISEDLYDGFQTACDGLPCGWTDVGTGQVRLVPSFHESEVGVLLDEGAIIERGLDPLVVEPTVDLHHLNLVIGCDAEASVTIGLILRVDGAEVPFMIDGRGGSIDQPGLVETPYFGMNVEAEAISVERIRFTRHGPGRCFVDELQFISGGVNQCHG